MKNFDMKNTYKKLILKSMERKRDYDKSMQVKKMKIEDMKQYYNNILSMTKVHPYLS